MSMIKISLSVALFFSLLFFGGGITPYQTTYSQSYAHSLEWDTSCMLKGGAALGIPGAAYSLATGVGGFVAGALLGGTNCTHKDKPEKRVVSEPMRLQGNRIVVYFNFDSSNLRSSGLDKLNLLVGALRKNDSIEVVGFACDQGSRQYNQVLSEERAESVRQYLALFGIPRDKIKTRGEVMPEPSSRWELGTFREQYRSAEITLIRHHR